MANKQKNTPSLSAEQAKTILYFLQRASLQGSEMPAYIEIFNALSSVAGESASKPDQDTP